MVVPHSIAPARFRLIRTVAVWFALAGAVAAPAQDAPKAMRAEPSLRLSGPFSDHAVLQRDTVAAIHGFTEAGARVEAVAGWPSARTATAVADRDGRFVLRLQTPGAGGPYEIVVRRTDGDDEPRPAVRLRDVWLGDVWLLAGDDLLAAPIAATAGALEAPGVAGQERVVAAAAKTPRVRICTIARTASPAPLGDVAGGWEVAGPDNARSFSAVAWFFGAALHAALDVPIGLVVATAADEPSPIAAWLSPSALEALAESDPPEEDARNLPPVTAAARAALAGHERAPRLPDPEAIARDWQRWVADCFARLSDADDDIGAAAHEHDDGDWAVVDLSTAQRAAPLRGFDGLFWLRTEFRIPRAIGSVEGARLHLGSFLAAERVWLDGRPIGATTSRAALDRPRVHPVPAELLTPGRHTLALALLDFGSLDGFAPPSCRAARPATRRPGARC